MPPTLSKDFCQTIKLRTGIAEQDRDENYKPLVNRAWARYRGEDYRYDGDGGGRGKSAPVGRTPFRLNYDWSIIQTKFCAISFNYPDVSVQPETDDAVPFSSICQHALKYEWDKIDAQSECKKALLDRLVGGMGIVYIGWVQETAPLDPDTRIESPGNSEATEAAPSPSELQQRDGLLVEGDRLRVQGDPTSIGSEFDKDAAPIKYEQVVRDEPIIRRIDPLAFFADPECGNKLNDAAYCGYIEYRPLDDLKRDPRFKNVKNLKGSSESLRAYLASSTSEGDSLKEETIPSDVKRVKLIHYYDKQRRIHAIFCSEHDKPLLVEDFSWPWAGYPFVVIVGWRSPNDWWPTPESLYLEAPIRELEQARALQAQFMRMAVPKVTVKGEPLKPHQKKQIQSSVPYTAIELQIGQSLESLPLPQNPVELQYVEKAAKDDIQTIGGLSAYDTATAPTKRMTTAEVQVIQQSGGPRILNDRQMFEQFCSRILRHMLDLLLKNLMVPLRLPIYDAQDNVKGFGSFDAAQIKGKFGVQVHVGSTTAPNSADTLGAIGYLVQSIGPIIQLLPQALQAGIDLRPVLIAAVKQIPGIRNVADILAPLEQQMAQQNAQQQPQGQPQGQPGGAAQSLLGPLLAMLQNGQMPPGGGSPPALPPSPGPQSPGNMGPPMLPPGGPGPMPPPMGGFPPR